MSNTALLFLVCFFVGLLLAFVKHPIYGVLSYMLVFYMGPGEAWWALDVPDLRWSLVAAGVTLVAAMRHPAPPSRPPWYKTGPARWMIVFVLWLWIQTPWVISTNDHVFLASLFTKYLVLYALLYTSLTGIREVRYLVFAHIVGCFLWAYTAYLHPGSGRLETIGYGDVSGSAFASMHLGTGLVFAGFAFLGASGLLRWVAFSAIPFVLNAIILMATRGAFVGLLMGIPAALYLTPRSKRTLVVVSVTLAPLLLVVLAHDLFWNRMATIPVTSEASMDASAESRIEVAQANYRMFLDYPWGVGHRGNDRLSPRYMHPDLLTKKDGAADGEPVRSAHNTLMAILVDHGFVGIILFVLLHISIARSALRIRFQSGAPFGGELGAYAAAVGTSLVVYWVNAQFVNVTKAEVVVWIAALAGALEWMANATRQAEVVKPVAEKAPADYGAPDLTIPSARSER
jgi:hypothetical protein